MSTRKRKLDFDAEFSLSEEEGDENGTANQQATSRKRQLSELDELFEHEDIVDDEFSQEELDIIYGQNGKNIEKQRGINVEEIQEVFDVVENMNNQLKEKHEKKISYFVKALTSSLENRAKFLASTLTLENEEAEEIDNYFETTSKEFLEKAIQQFQEVNEFNDTRATMLKSLADVTVIKIARALANYYEFLSKLTDTDEKEKLSIESLKESSAKGDYSLVRESLEKMFLFLTLSGNKQHKNRKLQPDSVTSVLFSLFIVFKVLGIIDYTTSRRELSGLQSVIQMRASFHNIGCSSPLFKMPLTLKDVTEFFKWTAISNMQELRDMVYLFVLVEIGVRNGSAIGTNSCFNGHKGILLKDLRFRFLEQDGHFEIMIGITHEKQERDVKKIRPVYLATDARISYLCGAKLLLFYLCLMKFTTNSMSESIKMKKIEIKDRFLEYPLFSATIGQKCPIPGSTMTDDASVMMWLSNKTGLPKRILSARSCRKGHATSITNEVRMKNPTITPEECLVILKSTNAWGSNVAKKYMNFDNSRRVPYMVAGIPNDVSIERSIAEDSLSSIVYGGNFKARKDFQSAVFNSIKFPDLDVKLESLKKEVIDIQGQIESKEEKKVSRKSGSILTKEQKLLEQKMRERELMRQEIKFKRVSVYSQKVDELRYLNYKKAKDLCDRFISPKEIGTDIDIDVLEQLTAHVKIASPLGSISYIRTFDELLLDGVQCPIKGCEDRALDITEFRNHRKEKHPSERHRSVLPYVCRHENCDPDKEYSCGSFYIHNKTFHSFEFKCQTCDMDLSSANKKAHIDSNPDHIVDYPWCWKPFIIPSMNIRCSCSEKLSLPNEYLCVLDIKKIQCVFFDDLPDIYTKSINDITQKNCSKKAMLNSICSKILEITEEELPICLQNKISSIC